MQEPTKGYHWSQRDKGTQAGPRRHHPYSPTASPRMDAATDDGRGGGAHPWYTHGHQPPPYGMQPPPSPHRGRTPSYGGAVAYIHAEYDRNGNSRQYDRYGDRYGDDYGSPPPPVARRPSYMAESPRCCLIPVPCAAPGPMHQPYPYDASPPPPPPPDYGPPAPGCCTPSADPYGREPEMYYGNGLYDRDPYYQGPIAERHVGSRSPGARPQMVSNKKVQADLEDDGNGNVLGGGGTSLYGGDGSTTGRTDLTEVALQRHLRQQQGVSPQKPGGGGVRQWLQEGGPRAATVDHGTGMDGMGVGGVPPAVPYGVELQQQQAAPRQSQRWPPHASIGTDMATPVSSFPQQQQMQLQLQQQQLMQVGPGQGQAQAPSVWDEGFAAPPPRVQPQAPRHGVVLALPEQQQQMLQPRQSVAFAPRQSMAAAMAAAAEAQDHQYDNVDEEGAWQQQPRRSSMAQSRRDSVLPSAEPARPRRAGSGSEQEDTQHTAGRASRTGSRAVTPSRLRNSSRQDDSPSQQQHGRTPRSSLPPRRRVSYKDPVQQEYDDEGEDGDEEENEEYSDKEGRSGAGPKGRGGRGAAADEYDVPGVEVDDVYVQELLQVVNGMLADMAGNGTAAARHSPRQAGGRRQGSASKSPAKRRVSLAHQQQQQDPEDQQVQRGSNPRASIAAAAASPAALPTSAQPSMLAPAVAPPQEVVDPSPVTAAEAAAAASAGLSGILEIGRDVEEATRAALGRLASHSSPAGITTTPRNGGSPLAPPPPPLAASVLDQLYADRYGTNAANAAVGFAGMSPEPLAPGGWATLGVDASPARSGSRVTLSYNGGGADANPDAYAARQRQASYLDHAASTRSSVAVGGPYPHSMYGSPYGTSDAAPAPGGLPSVHTQLSGGHRYVAFDNPLASLAEDGSGGAVRSVAGAPPSGGGTRTSPLLSDVLFSSLAPDLAWEVASALGGVGSVDEYGNGAGDGGQQQQAVEAAAAKRLALPSMGYGNTSGDDGRNRSGMFAPVARKSSTVVNLNASPGRAGDGGRSDGGNGEEAREVAGGESGAYGRPRESSAVTLSDKLRSLAALASDAAVRLHTFAPRLGSGASQADGNKHSGHSTANALSQVSPLLHNTLPY